VPVCLKLVFVLKNCFVQISEIIIFAAVVFLLFNFEVSGVTSLLGWRIVARQDFSVIC